MRFLFLLTLCTALAFGAGASVPAPPYPFVLCLGITVPDDESPEPFAIYFRNTAKTWKLSLDPNIEVRSQDVCEGANQNEVRITGQMTFEKGTQQKWKITLTIAGQPVGDPETVQTNRSDPLQEVLIPRAKNVVDLRIKANPWPLYKEFVKNWKQKLPVAQCNIPGSVCSLLPLPYRQFWRLATNNVEVLVPGYVDPSKANIPDKCQQGYLILDYSAPKPNISQLGATYEFESAELKTVDRQGKGNQCLPDGPQ
jgi:hypothetical protein